MRFPMKKIPAPFPTLSPMIEALIPWPYSNALPNHFTKSANKTETVREHQSTAIPGQNLGREKVIVLGSGWGGYTFSRRLTDKLYACTIVSPRSYFVFTPLLIDTTTGNLDFSDVVEPVRDPKVKVDFIQAAARAIDFKNRLVTCEASVVKSGVTESPRVEEEGPETGAIGGKKRLRQWEKGQVFKVPYDKLVITVGSVNQTFNTPGVKENAMFFKDIGDSRRVKRRVRECFELAVLPNTTENLQRFLLHFAIVGAGPTGTELAATLRDFIYTDMLKLYPLLNGKPRISLYDITPTVLNMFDKSLSEYAMDMMTKEGIEIKTSHHIEKLRWGLPNSPGSHEMDPKGCLTLKTSEEGDVGIGVCVWVTGTTMNTFIKYALDGVMEFPSSAIMKDGAKPPLDAENATWHIKKAPKVGALLVDGQFHVQIESEDGKTAILQDAFAIGDNSMPETGAPPATAQATSQEAKWLASRFNNRDFYTAPNFSFRNMGAIAYIGDAKALIQIPHEEAGGYRRNRYLPKGLKGRTAWLAWNVAYLSMTISWRSRIRVLFRWIMNRFFGKDISRF